MKQYIYLFLFTLLFVGASCRKSFLDEKPNGSVLSPALFFGADSAQVTLAGDDLPNQFRNTFGQSGCVSPFMGGDDLTAYFGSNKWAFREGDQFAVSDINDRIVLWWQNCYKTIRSANGIIDNIDKSIASQSCKDDIKGQAYFYRGLSYSFLTRIFGEVPLITVFSTHTDLSIKNSSPDAIYTQIVNDLQQAETLLPAIRPEKAGDRGGFPGAKPCKGTVKSLMSQVYLTMAGWPLKQTTNYALAAAKAKEVIDNHDMYGYQLVPNPNDLWTWANNYTNTEMVLCMYFNNTTEQTMHDPLGEKSNDEIIGGWANGWFDYYAEISFFKRYPAGARKNATFQTIIPNTGLGIMVPWDSVITYDHHPHFKKYQDDVPGASWIGARAHNVIRYAEVLLNYAEAQAMSAGPDASAYAAINQIRTRAGLPNLTPGLSATAFRDSVIAERSWEFAGGEPASRWFDMIRTETVETATALRDPTEIPIIHAPSKANYWMVKPSFDAGLDPNIIQPAGN